MPDDDDLITADDPTVADKWARDSWKIYTVAACLVLLAVGLALVYLKGVSDKSAIDVAQSKTLKCVSDWSDRYSARVDLLTKLSAPRNDALAGEINALNRFLDVLPSKNKAEIDAAYRALSGAAHAFNVADSAYRDALSAHPLPPTPRLACGLSATAPTK